MTNEKKPNSENNKELEVSFSYTDKHVVETGELVDVPRPDNIGAMADVILKKDGYTHLISYPIKSIEEVPFGLQDMRFMYMQNGGDTQEIYAQMKKYVMDNIDNDKAIQYFMGNFCSSVGKMYADGEHYEEYGDDVPEVLEEILSRPDGDMGKSFVCMNIAQLGMDVLHDCGIDAVIFSGIVPSSGGHAAILYKNKEGKYTFVNYGDVDEIAAPSLKEAALTVYNRSKSMYSNGQISFIDGNSSYNEYALKDVAVWGDELDKRNYNSENVFDKYYVKRPKVSVGVNYSSSVDTSASIEYTKPKVEDGHIRNLTLGAGIQKNSISPLFASSRSVGYKLEYKGANIGDNSSIHFGVKSVGNYVSGESEGRDSTTLFHSRESFMKSVEPAYIEFRARGFSDEEISLAIENAYNVADLDNTKYIPDKRMEYLTGFLRGYFAVENDLAKIDNIKVSNMAEASVTGYVASAVAENVPISFDYRLAVEDGVKFAMNKSNTDFSSSLSAGALFDCQRTSDRQLVKFSPGLKLNAGSVFETKVNDNLSVGGGVSGYTVFTAPATDYGATANTFVSYKSDSNTVFTGSAGVECEYQKMHIGGINEMTENNNSFNVSLSAEHGNDAFRVGYSRTVNGINDTRSKSTFNVGYKRTF